MRGLLLVALAVLSASAFAQTTLGAFTFDNAKFGSTLWESDGGTWSGSNWLNVANVNPGNPGYLTGANFDTGIANIGISGTAPEYIITYSSPIVNLTGADLGAVVARYSDDEVWIAFSEDGNTFGGYSILAPGTATATGVSKAYFYNGGGPYNSQLYVHSLDLSNYGIAAGNGVQAVKVSTGPLPNQLDLVRVAGFYVVPEPATFLALGLGVAAMLLKKRG